MRILHLPENIASIPSYTVKALRDNGVDAKAFFIRDHYCQSSHNNNAIKIINTRVGRKNFPLRKWRQLISSYYFLRYLHWADLIHWHFTTKVLPLRLDLRLIKLMNKPALVEFHGTDIRIPEVEYKDNPYYKHPFKKETYKKSRTAQTMFARAGFNAIIDPGDMLQYIQKDIFPNPFLVKRRIALDEFIPKYPENTKQVPLILHTPSDRKVKGTKYVLEVMDKLMNKYKIEFMLIENKNRKECLELMQNADIFLDQFIGGWYGMAAVEAMAFGKPAVCYIKPTLYEKRPQDFPIVNTTIDNLEKTLETLIIDGQLRHNIGKCSRAYVEAHHDANKISLELIDIYREVIRSRHE